MEYPKPVMKMGELVKMGFPRSFLDEAYRERGQDFEKWRARKQREENRALRGEMM